MERPSDDRWNHLPRDLVRNIAYQNPETYNRLRRVNRVFNEYLGEETETVLTERFQIRRSPRIYETDIKEFDSIKWRFFDKSFSETPEVTRAKIQKVFPGIIHGDIVAILDGRDPPYYQIYDDQEVEFHYTVAPNLMKDFFFPPDYWVKAIMAYPRHPSRKPLPFTTFHIGEILEKKINEEIDITVDTSGYFLNDEGRYCVAFGLSFRGELWEFGYITRYRPGDEPVYSSGLLEEQFDRLSHNASRESFEIAEDPGNFYTLPQDVGISTERLRDLSGGPWFLGSVMKGTRHNLNSEDEKDYSRFDPSRHYRMCFFDPETADEIFTAEDFYSRYT